MFRDRFAVSYSSGATRLVLLVYFSSISYSMFKIAFVLASSPPAVVNVAEVQSPVSVISSIDYTVVSSVPASAFNTLATSFD